MASEHNHDPNCHDESHNHGHNHNHGGGACDHNHGDHSHSHSHSHVHDLAHKHESLALPTSPRVEGRRRSSMSEQEVQQVEEKIHKLAEEFEKAHLKNHEVDLDHLSEEEQQKFRAAKEALAKSPTLQAYGALDTDNILLKFLTSAKFDPAACVTKYEEYRKWRVDNKVDDMLKNPPPYGDLMHKLIPHGYIGFDKQGRPIYIERTGKIRVTELVAHVTNDQMMKSHIYGMEYMCRQMKEQTAKLGRPVDTLTTILDFEGLSFQHANAMFMLQSATSLDTKYYPERVHQVFVINAPWIAPTLWEMAKQFLDDSVKSRLSILDGNYQQELLKYIDADQLPVEYGGTLKLNPPDLLIPGTEEEIKELLNRDATGLVLQEEYVSAGKAFRVVLPGKQGDEFIWSFVVSNEYDIQFSIELESAGASETVKIKQPSRTTANKGSYVADADCQVTFIFDNSYSYFNGKTFKYHTSVKPK